MQKISVAHILVLFFLLASCSKAETTIVPPETIPQENRSPVDDETVGSQVTLLSNMALGKGVKASNNEQLAEILVDGERSSEKFWSSGGEPPQWVEIDFGELVDIYEIQLFVFQFPIGESLHKILGRAAANEEFTELHEFNEYTATGDKLSFSPNLPWKNVRYLRVESLETPETAFVEWSEIEVIGLPAGAVLLETDPIQSNTDIPGQLDPVEHRIGVRYVDGVGEFYDRQTDEVFVPRGVNYNRWTNPQAVPGRWDALFNTSFGQLDKAKEDLKELRASGYNMVRVFVNLCWGNVPGCMGNPEGGLSAEYMDNMVTFLRYAEQNDIYVMFTNDQLPEVGGYFDYQNAYGGDEFNGNNITYLTQGGIKGNRVWFQDFIQALIDRNAPFSHIFSFELKNEAYYDKMWPPFSLTEGLSTSVNGNTYDMASLEQQQLMMDEGWLYWIDEMVDGIKEIDPTALVSMGFFEPQGIESGRMLKTDIIIQESSLDFIDIHAYPDIELTSLDEYAQRFGIDGTESKPIVLGEFGAGKEPVPSLIDAARMLQWWQVDSCRFGIDGWLLWSWGTGDTTAEFWSAVDGDREIDHALSPEIRPDPCEPGTEMLDHPVISFRKPTTASIEEGQEYNADKAFDGTLLSWWSAAEGAPQWIEVDLEEPHNIRGFRIYLGNITPDEFNHFRIWGKSADEEYRLLHEFRGDGISGDALEYSSPEVYSNIQFVRIEIVQMEDWVIIYEIEVIEGQQD